MTNRRALIRPILFVGALFCGALMAYGVGLSLARPSAAQAATSATESPNPEIMRIMEERIVTDDMYCEDVCSLPENDEELKKILSPEQYRIVRENGTERPFANAYWNNKREGLYVDIVGGRPLFTSREKYDSGTGWPSFWKPALADEIVEIEDRSHGMLRVEVRSKTADSHLGHVFPDGPEPTGQRYCINSASMRFIAVDDLEKEGYGAWLPYFGREAKGTTQKANAPDVVSEAMFGAGCFWGVEGYFRQLPGVLDTAVGYSGGQTENPTYKEVCSGRTGHAEVLHVKFDPSKISYEDLLGHFFKLHDPTQLNRQGPDVGTQYRSAVFFYDDEQQKAAEKVKTDLQASGSFKRPIVTEITKASTFWRAEEYHQNYLEKNGLANCHF